jgi:hypothetical protein
MSTCIVNNVGGMATIAAVSEDKNTREDNPAVSQEKMEQAAGVVDAR